MGANTAQPVGVHDDDFPWLYIADEFCIDSIKRTGFGCNHVGAAQLADDKGTEAERIARGDELLRAHHQQGISAPDAPHHAHHSLLDAARGNAVLRDHMGDHFRVDRRLEDRAASGELFPHRFGIRKVAIVRDGEAALCIAHQKRLAILHEASAGCGVADVADRNLPWQGGKHVVIEHLADQAHRPVDAQHASVADCNAAALLPAVLQGIEAVIGGPRRGRFQIAVNAEYAAFLMGLVKHRNSS